MCLKFNNPSLTLLHVISLTVPTKTEPVGTNPFEEDEEQEEEMAEEEQTTVNHVTVNKEEIKTLVKQTTLRQPAASFSSTVSIFDSLDYICSPSLWLLFFWYPSFFSSGLRFLCCSAWSLNGTAHKVSVCLSFTRDRFMFYRV